MKQGGMFPIQEITSISKKIRKDVDEFCSKPDQPVIVQEPSKSIKKNCSKDVI